METDNYKARENHSRRRRNVDLTGKGEKQDSEKSKSYGTQWGDSEIGSHRDEVDSTESYTKVPQSFCEEPMEEQDQETTVRFRLGNCEVSIGQLQAPTTVKSQGSRKLTIYVDKELLNILEELKRKRLIPSYSWLVGEALKQYLVVNGE